MMMHLHKMLCILESNQICFHVNCQQNSKNHVKSNPHMEVLLIGFKSIIYVCDFSVDVPVHVI